MLHFSQNLASPSVELKSRVTFFTAKVDASGGVVDFPVKASTCFS
jgi:hypothetical protein